MARTLYWLPLLVLALLPSAQPEQTSEVSTQGLGDDVEPRNCTVAAIEQFPRPLMSPRLRRLGGVAVHVLAAVYMFVALSIICEDYFVPALEVICDALHIDPDVAGATFMAAASSVPAIAASIIAILVSRGEMGVSTALGSAVLNAAGVISVSALFAGKVVVLHRWPMYRDSVFFLASVVILLVALQDEEISQLESVLLLVTYGVYAPGPGTTPSALPPATLSVSALVTAQEGGPPGSLKLELAPMDGRRPSHGLVLMPSRRASQAPGQLSLAPGLLQGLRADASARAHSLDVTGLRQNQLAARRRSLAADPNRRRISLISLRSSKFQGAENWRITRFSHANIHPFTQLSQLFFYYICEEKQTPNIHKMYLLPSEKKSRFKGVRCGQIAMHSRIRTLAGFGDMAVCNALGSNIFEILVGLGLPWFLKTVLISPGSPAVVEGKGLAYSTACLLSTIVFLLVLTHVNKWKMNKLYGAILMAWYLVFMTVACLYELNVFAFVNLPSCESDY
ncbi:potassium-dependent sodium-calcium exchanger, putative [Ixodes scapularis]|uniref:Potassium-dependent sodium-calcium exchanger, putative n=1 Tax=Ixodes scapularis TaxID=6945 RepID=B7Q4G9_IXOSC|nr:potassium-dependent sodium-calcium exchanger, putative [Ixodes scapularis]|eukprot:XP_002400449.1 potassium-dependent sodium-calcium exchanger, putative [Ixodes scapularis]